MPSRRPAFTRYIRREPLGIVLTVAPWNYPYLTAVNTVVPALMAGNAVLLKHAAQTHPGRRPLPGGDGPGRPARRACSSTLVLDHDDTDRDLIGAGASTTSASPARSRAGAAIERAAAGTFTAIGLELGGKDPAYVRADADLDACGREHRRRRVLQFRPDAAAASSASTCTSDVYDSFVDGFVDLTRQYVLGDPLDQKTTLGPMARTRFADVVREQIGEAVAKGAKRA